ncbi:MAG: 5'-methylthioadenosine phosphorylase, partial [Pseudomonadota bacterium]
MLAIIGGTGLASEDTFTLSRKEIFSTNYGEPSSALMFGELNQIPVIFLSRHGFKHNIPPHKVN